LPSPPIQIPKLKLNLGGDKLGNMKKLGNILNKSIKKVITQNKQKQLYMKGGTLSIRDEENFENYINLKTLIIYNEQLIKIDEFIVEQVTNIS